MFSFLACYTSLVCSKIEHVPFYNLIFTTKCNDVLILITIISWDYLNLLLANDYVENVAIPTQVISQSHCSIHMKSNYIPRHLVKAYMLFFS